MRNSGDFFNDIYQNFKSNNSKNNINKESITLVHSNKEIFFKENIFIRINSFLKIKIFKKLYSKVV